MEKRGNEVTYDLQKRFSIPVPSNPGSPQLKTESSGKCQEQVREDHVLFVSSISFSPSADPKMSKGRVGTEVEGDTSESGRGKGLVSEETTGVEILKSRILLRWYTERGTSRVTIT